MRLPGFRLTFGFTVTYLSLVVLIPLSLLVWHTFNLTFTDFINTVTSRQVVASYRLTFTATLLAALTNAVFGFMLAWSLVRYRFPGRRFIDAIVDIPFAMPTAVSGIALTTLCANTGWVGYYAEKYLGWQLAYTPTGVYIALTFIGLPFVVRTLQPALEDLDKDVEEAAEALGATRFQTFRRILFPAVLPALLTGFTLAFARALGEYGSVVFIAGNIPFSTEITSLLIYTKLEEFEYPKATAIALVMLVASFFSMLFINLIQWYTSKNN
ncbi:MAG: sulfate ABC transporter permease subunit CysT [Planctomycetaceae bacterium]|jgi:sulfate transport system permease protein|nr:sulfate ABC transporter permease subunit CysT [Planctomycetaceae bacterium]